MQHYSLQLSVVLPPVWLSNLIRGLVFIFPITLATLGWGSGIMLLLLLAALVHGRGWAGMPLAERRLMLAFVVMFCVMALSLVNSEDMHEGLKALDRYFHFVLLIPVYLMFRRYRLYLGKEFVAGAIVATFAMGAQAYYQVEVARQGIAEGYYHKIVFGDLAVLWGAFVTIFATVVVSSWRLRLLLLLAVVVALYASVASQTRGGWLFVPLLPVILLWAEWHRLRLQKGTVIALLLAALIALLAVGMKSEHFTRAIENGAKDLKAFVHDPSGATSWGIRLNLWRNSMMLLEEHPLIGTGLGDFQHDMQRMVEDGRSWNPHVANFGHAHSIYIDTLAKSGLLGFAASVVAILLLPLMVFVRALRSAQDDWDRFYALGGVVLVAAFATFGLSEGLWSRNPFVNAYIMSLLVFLSGVANRRNLDIFAEA